MATSLGPSDEGHTTRADRRPGRPWPGTRGAFVLAARLLARRERPLVIGKLVIASRWHHVRDVLRRDLEFSIVPTNERPIEETNGRFLLGADRGRLLASDRPLIDAAMASVDLEALRRSIRAEADAALEATPRGERVDVAQAYARRVATRTALALFGVHGPSEVALQRACRAIFHRCFLDPKGDRRVVDEAARQAPLLRGWIDAEIGRRLVAGGAPRDVLDALLRLTHGDRDRSARNLSGMLLGAIDTTSTSVAKIVSVLASDERVLRRATRDADDIVRVGGWCREALRVWPHNPLLLRTCVRGAELAGTTIPADAKVIAFTQAAMLDPAAFPDPRRLDPDRAASLYFHFGGDMHPCAGRAVNDVQLPELVAALLRRGIRSVGRPRFDGPFLDELKVELGR